MKPRAQVSRAAIALIKRFEGFRDKAAQMPDGRWTLGYGHTGAIGFDLSVMYLDFKERTRNRSFDEEPIFFGTYNTQAVLVGATLNF